MTRLTVLTGGEFSRLLQRIGFSLVRQRGSHAYFHHPDGRSTVVPLHKGETLGRGLLRSILRDIDLSPGDYERLRREL